MWHFVGVEHRIPLETDAPSHFSDTGKVERLIMVRIAWLLLEGRIERCLAFDRFWKIVA
jgi:hypothetical protein